VSSFHKETGDTGSRHIASRVRCASVSSVLEKDLHNLAAIAGDDAEAMRS
jgi:hypothetical protein